MQNILNQQYFWNIVLGVIISAVGLLAFALSFFRRKHRDLFLLSFGASSLIYGLRLIVETQIGLQITNTPSQTQRYIVAFLSYVIPIPLSGFLLLLFGRGRGDPMLWVFRAAIIFAIVAILSDVIQMTPSSAMRFNNILIIIWAILMFVKAFWPGMKMTRDLRVVMVGFLLFGIFAVNENLVALNLLPWQWRSEVLGFLAFLISLGYVTVHRFFDSEKKLFAVQNEMETARRIQFYNLPRRMPSIEGWEIVARYIPMLEVAGDFYDIIVLDKNRLSILVADVSGHGIGAALIASMLKVAFASQKHQMSNPAQVLAGMNKILSDKMENNFVTAGCLLIDTNKGIIRYAGAGHPPLLLWRKAEKKMYELCKNGLILGPFIDAQYSNTKMNYKSGDRIFLYSDGIIEAKNIAGSYFGDASFKNFIKTHEDLTAEQFADMFLQHLFRWAGKPSNGSLDDDLTFLVIDNLEQTA